MPACIASSGPPTGPPTLTRDPRNSYSWRMSYWPSRRPRSRACDRGPRRLRGDAGFTLIELLIVVAIIGILASIGLALYVNVQARGRIARAQADVRMLTSAVGVFSAHTGNIPTDAEGLAVLATIATNPQGQTAGPFVNAMPSPPAGGSPAWPVTYTYRADVASGGAASTGHFVICAEGDGVVAHSASGSSTCP
jgi:general secretion pathway protein G